MKQFMDSLQWQAQIAADPALESQTFPAFCVDAALDIEKEGYAAYMHDLEKAVGFDFHCIKCVKKGLNQWIQRFADHGCKTAAHTLAAVPYAEATDMELTGIYKKAMGGEALSVEEIAAYKTGLLLHCARQYAKQGMAMEVYVPCPTCSEAAMAQIQTKLEAEKPQISLLAL